MMVALFHSRFLLLFLFIYLTHLPLRKPHLPPTSLSSEVRYSGAAGEAAVSEWQRRKYYLHGGCIFSR